MRRGLAIACVALLAGCGGEPERGGVLGVQYSEEPRFATPAEVRWLAKVADWSRSFAGAGTRVAEFEDAPEFERVLTGETSAVARYRRILAPVRACGRSFGISVGRAPTPRLRESEQGFRKSCVGFRRGVDLMLRALTEQDPDLADGARQAIQEAGKASAIAAGTLPPGEKQPLPRRGGLRKTSRIEPRLSRAASRVAEKDVEVRCWSRPDWRRLMVEERAFTRGKVNDSVLGFASAGGARVSLAPSICRTLGRLVYRHERPAGETAQLELALALVTLAHESAHVSGVVDEPTAECHGIQLSDRAASSLGVEAAYAAYLKELYWLQYDRLPDVYRSPECRDGGELDLHASTSAFP